jgi:fructosamine-3-kinase
MTFTPQGKKLRDKIERHMGCPIVDLRFYATGQNANLYLVDLTDDRRLMAKIMREDDAETPSSLEAEGWMLDYLARKTKLPVPRVYWCDANTILMDFVENSGVMSAAVQENAAESLAALHGIEAEFYGLERDTTISPYNQPNHFETDWIDFFRDYRLLHMAREALGDGSIEPAIMLKIEKLAAKLEGYINKAGKPGLIHGDLWGGNILLGQGKVATFIDPAIYYADPEMDLAAICLFNIFGDAFFKRYNEIRPACAGFDTERRYIYSLYPLLVSARSQGPRYVTEIEAILKKFVG